MVYIEIECSLAAIELCNRRKDSIFFLKKKQPKTYGQLVSPLPKFTCKKVALKGFFKCLNFFDVIN